MTFPLGRIVATPAALEYMEELGIDPYDLLARHVNGDWGDMDVEDRQQNDLALLQGTRVFSSYSQPDGKIWIITEADRSVTTLLLPEDY